MLYFWCWNKTFLFTFLTLLQSIECWVLTLPHFSANKLLLTTWNSRSMTETHLNRHSQHCFIRQLWWPNDGSFVSVLQQSPEKVPEDESASVGESEIGVLRQYGDRKAPHLRSLIVNKSLSNFMTLWQCENTHQLTEVLIRGIGEVHQRRAGDIPGVLILLFLSRGLLHYLQLDDAAQVQGRLLLGGEVLGVLMDVLMYEVRVITAEKGHVLTGDQQRASCFLHEVTTFHWSLELQPWTSNGYKISEINHYPRWLTSCYFGTLQMMSKSQNRWTPSKTFQWDLHTKFITITITDTFWCLTSADAESFLQINRFFHIFITMLIILNVK